MGKSKRLGWKSRKPASQTNPAQNDRPWMVDVLTIVFSLKKKAQEYKNIDETAKYVAIRRKKKVI